MTISPLEPKKVDADEGGFLTLMRQRNYAILWTSQLISQLGTRLHWVAISLWVYSRTGSALSVSYVIMALMISPAVVGLFAGAIIDRFDRRKILIYGDLVRAALVFAIPDLMSRGMIWVYLDLVLVSAASAFFRPAMFAVIPQSVPKKWLLKANANYAALESATEVLGPAAAGILVARLGYASGLYLDALTYTLSAMLVSTLRLPVVEQHAREQSRLSTSQLIREGLDYVRRDRIQWALLVFLFAGQWVVGLSSLQTPLAKGAVGISDRQFGWFQSVWGMGFVAASLYAGSVASRLPRGRGVVISYFLWALAAGAMALSRNYPMLLVAGFWVGFANILLFVNVGTLLMEHTPTDRIGRAITIRQVALALVRVSALFGFGWLADNAGVRTAIFLMAALSALGTAYAAIRYPDLWNHGVGVAPRRLESEAEVSLATGPFWARADFFLDAYGDKEFGNIQQRWMNVLSLGTVFFAWILFLAFDTTHAVWVATACLAAIAGGVFARWVGQRLKGSPAGKD